MNVYLQRDAIGAVFRVIPYGIKSVDELGLPSVVKDLARYQRGFVCVTGPTGSGKSTTLAAMVDIVNEERRGHIMTIEDPIEYLHKHKPCIVNQREVGADTHSFAPALKHVLRQDPDVILVGEMRDLETISTAITAAETGHLVFATLHTQDAPQTIDRIIDVFPRTSSSRSGSSSPPRCRASSPSSCSRPRTEGPRRGLGDPDRHARRAQPDPRGQGAPDLLDDAGGRALRHADDGPVARRAREGAGKITSELAYRALPRSRGSWHRLVRRSAAE